MSKAIAATTFDYSQVDKDTKGKLIVLGGQLKRHGDVLRTAGNEIGKAVIEAHELLASQRVGLFDEWVATETEIGLSTAYNCLNAAKRAIEFPIIGKLPPTVAYMMAGPKVPDAAIKDFEKQIDKGVRPTIEACKATLKRFRTVRPKKKSKPAPPVTVPPAPEAPPDPGPTGPCIRTGGEHRWGPDEDKHGYLCCLECGEPGALIAVDPEPDVPTSKLFAKIDEYLGKVVRLLDDINKLAPNEPLRKEIVQSLDVANEDIRKWKKGAKK